MNSIDTAIIVIMETIVTGMMEDKVILELVVVVAVSSEVVAVVVGAKQEGVKESLLMIPTSIVDVVKLLDMI